MLWLAVTLGVAGVGALRYAWSLPRRSPVANGTGWALLGLATILAAVTDGAWGVSVAALGAMLTAFAILAVAGIRSPEKSAKASNRRVGMLPEQGEPKRIGRRVVTFLLLIVAGFAVSVGLGLAMRGLGSLLGWSESNANVLALYSVPLTWSVLVTAMLMQQTRRSQVLLLLACCIPVLPVLVSGVVQ
ncbi:hypothetical protein KK137_01355 [Croceibacterium sp. LX-88]|uniref:Uncharacterized protein n=1 Tax=Croceibacterium selenioxidans TaxID=2838833 RepID=A0ABS5W0Y1_9SPHN|nr:hypothetical protein [Croceibacterium selenioxidans]MBT2132967.1 hypothetical protein [Croceibacterium selenioxidans]